MRYFVSVEYRNYQLWQLELLIESFNMLGLQDQLVVGVAWLPGQTNKSFARNLDGHKNKFFHPNYGRQKGLPHLNKSYGSYLAAKDGLLSDMTCVIDPDMILVKPLQPPAGVSFHIDPTFTAESAVKNGIKVDGDWVPVGHVYTFNDLPVEIYGRAAFWTEKLVFGLEKPWAGAGRAGWAMAINECVGKVPVKGVYDYEMHLLDNGVVKNFVHYAHGLPPVWHKKMYSYESGLVMGGESPYDGLLENNPTTSTNAVQAVVKNYLGKMS